jgi:MFS family permease
MVLIGAYLLMSLSTDGELLLGGVLYGIGNGLSWPSFLAMISESGPPELQGAVQGLGGSAGSLASIVGTLTGGVLYVTQGVAVLYLAAATIAVTTWLFVAAARNPRVGSVDD